MLKDGTLSSIGHKAQKQLKKQKAENKAGNWWNPLNDWGKKD